MFQYLSVGDSVLPFDVQEVAQTAEVESVGTLLLSGIGCPGLAAVQECGKDTCTVNV